ncbi:hypothetical protein ACOMHN_032443 [Nucella lapillus]
MRTSAILRNPVELTVKLEVEKFKVYGILCRTQTFVHNSLPSSETIETEKTLMSFEEKRRTEPENAPYDNFYRSLTSSVTTPLPASRAAEVLRSSRISSHGPKTPKSTTFSMFPALLPNQGKLLATPTQSVLSRLVTSYGRRPGESLLEDLRPAESRGSVRSSRADSSREMTLTSESEPNSCRYLDLDERLSMSSRI